jgi:multidrug efflux pump subunit AcrB
VTEGAKEIVKMLLEAIGLVIVVVFAFQNWRATLLALLTIPVSLVATARARLRVAVEQARPPRWQLKF